MTKQRTKLSRREKDTLKFIKDFMLKNNVAPTVREVCEGLGITSVSSAFMHMKNLQELGYLIPYGDTGRYSVKGLKIVEVDDAE